MKNQPVISLTVVALLCGLHDPITAEETRFRFLATGDAPYSAEQDTQYRQLLQQAAREDFAFLLHVGDIKAQSEPCSDEGFEAIADLFRQHPAPVVYTPGDNEWTDCHGVGADPIERLDKLRQLFFQDPGVLRLQQLGARFQSQQPEFSRFVENYRFTKAGVMFVVLHICGSQNNRRVDDAPSMNEFAQRSAANQVFLRAAFAEAIKQDVPGVAVIIHANPDFENGAEEGFHRFLETMRVSLEQYRKPVVCIHGDTHYYRIDKPLKSANGQLYLHFTRMEVFGSPNVAGVAVTVDRNDPEVFQYQPYYLGKSDAVHTTSQATPAADRRRGLLQRLLRRR
ncbi:MAG: hypothetical protein CMJ75_06970 [Planctomycetaceae bacterium]|nr:hypothetical protein [Planctomycetaceae bacterium]